MATETFSFRQVATSGCEIVGPDGVIGWTIDSVWAAVIVDLLNGANVSEPSHDGMLSQCQGNFKRK